MSLDESPVRPLPDLSFEQRLHGAGHAPVAGVDEAGRGPLAGPVVAAAVVFRTTCVPEGLDDSKRLTPETRVRLSEEIRHCAEVGVGIAEVARIDRDNILNATLWAMAQAVAALPSAPRFALIDGNRAPALACPCETVIGGDGCCASIAAASIVAKVTRDAIMTRLAETHPGFGWERNMGYATPEHRRALAELGATEHHRRSFAPVRMVVTGLTLD